MRRQLVIGIVLSALCVGAPAARAATPVLEWNAAAAGAAKDTIASAPFAPANLQVTSVMSTQVTLSWTLGSADATSIEVQGRIGSGAYQTVGTVGGNVTSVVVTNLQPSTLYGFRVRASNSDGTSAFSNEVTVTTLAAGTGSCSPSATSLCLVGNRFQITASFRAASGQAGNAQVVPLTDNSAYLWFFDPSNAELFLKVLNGCGLNNEFWFFASGLTNVRVRIDVIDMQTGATRTYINPINNPFQPIQDTSAFVCP
jgi:hypothetical protein